MHRISAMVFTTLVLTAGTAGAANGAKGDWDLGFHLGAGFPDAYGALNPENGIFVRIHAGYALTDRFSLELSNQHQMSETAGGGDAMFVAVRVNGLLNFHPGEKVRPFLTLGAGYEYAKLAATTERDVAPNVGAGVKWYLSDFGGLRVDGRYIPVYVGGAIDDWQHNFEGSAGFFVLFGKKTEKKAEPKPEPAPEPTPEATPEPTPEPVPAPVVLDTDGDGVTDDLDN